MLRASLAAALLRRVLVVFDSPGHLRAVRALLASVAEVRVARAAKSAVTLLEESAFDAAIFSGRLGGSAGELASLVAYARARLGPGASLLVVGSLGRELDAELLQHEVTVTEPPLSAETARALVEEAEPLAPSPSPESSTLHALVRILGELRDRASLTPTEIDVLTAVAFGDTREDLRERLRFRDATLRKHVSTILRKLAGVGVEAESLDRLVASLYIRATFATVSS